MKKLYTLAFAGFLAAPALAQNPGVTGTGPAFVNGHCIVGAGGARQVKDGGVCSAFAPVQSVFGRTGNVVAQAGDYNFTQISGTLGCAQMPTITGDMSNVNCAFTLATVNANVGTFGNGTNVAQFTVDGKGRITAAGNVPITNPTITLSGDTTGSGSTAITTTTGKVNGVAYPPSPSVHQTPVVTSAGNVTYKTITDCNGAGNALQYTQSTDLFSCNNSSAGVASFNTRTGAVVSILGDYTASIINYTANYTGALTRLVQLKLSGWVTLDDFTGIDCSGASASDAAMTSLLASGATKIRLGRTATGAACDAKLSSNFSIPSGTVLEIDCGGTFSLDASKTLTFAGTTNDTFCQKWFATGANSGARSGIVTGLKFNRPEYWGSFGDCNIGGTCTHDDSTSIQQAINSAQASATSDGNRPTVRLQGGKGYGVDTVSHTGSALTITPSLTIPLDFGGGSQLNGGDGNGGSWIIGKAGFTGDILVWVGTVANQSAAAHIHDFGLYSFTANQANSCFKIGVSNNINNNSIRAVAENLYIANCKSGIVVTNGTRIRGVNWSNIGIQLPSASNSFGILIDAESGTPSIGDMKFRDITIDASACVANNCVGFQVFAIVVANITNFDFDHMIIYPGGSGITIFGDSGNIQDFWCNNCQIDGLTKTGISIACDGGSTTCANFNFPNNYIVGNGSSVGFNGFEALATNSALLQGVTLNNSWLASMTPSQAVKISGVKNATIDDNRFSDINIAAGSALLIENCLGSCSGNNNRLWRTSGTPLLLNFVALSGTTDYSQACNNTGGGYTTTGGVPTVVSVSTASGIHNTSGAGCPNN